MQQLSVIFNQIYTTRFCRVLLSPLQLLEHMLSTRAGSHTLWHTQRAPELPSTSRAPTHLHSTLAHSLPWAAALPCSRESSWSGGHGHAGHQHRWPLVCALLLTPAKAHTLLSVHLQHTSPTLSVKSLLSGNYKLLEDLGTIPEGFLEMHKEA